MSTYHPSEIFDFFLEMSYNRDMGQISRARWSRMDILVQERGSEGLLDSFCSRVADGEHPRDIARSMGVHAITFREWIEGDPDRMKMFELAKRCLADHLQWDAIQEAQLSTVDTVSLGKYRTDTYRVAAGVMNRKEYGNKVDVDIGINLNLSEALALGRSRLQRVIEGEVAKKVEMVEIVEI